MESVPETSPGPVLYHGTKSAAARSILEQGFRVWLRPDPEDERVPSGGNLGNGIYVTPDPAVALWFGGSLLRVELTPGTRIVDASIPPDPKTIRYLVREFGRAILTDPPSKVLPRNKRLTRPELATLLRYHYAGAWENGDPLWRWRPRRERHFARLGDLRSVAVRYGIHGFGHPGNHNGLVVFAEDRLRPRELLAEVPPAVLTDEFLDSVTLPEIVRRFPPGACTTTRRGT